MQKYGKILKPPRDWRKNLQENPQIVDFERWKWHFRGLRLEIRGFLEGLDILEGLERLDILEELEKLDILEELEARQYAIAKHGESHHTFALRTRVCAQYKYRSFMFFAVTSVTQTL